MLNRQRVLVGGAVYLLTYALVTALFPAPGSPVVRKLLAELFLFFLPPALALLTTVAAARGSRGPERVFWFLLAGSALACVAGGLNRFLLDARELGVPWFGIQIANASYYVYLVLVTVALLVRPDLPRGPREVSAAALEWLMAAVGAGFLVVYFAALPAKEPRYPWFLVYAALEMVPGLAALVLANRVREPPFSSVYRLLALGFLAGALAGMVPTWFYPRGTYQPYNPMDIVWALPFFPMAAAALGRRAPTWVRSFHGPSVSDLRRVRLATLSVAFPPFLDIVVRAAGWQPELADARSHAALVSSAVLAILVALRIRRAARVLPAHEAPADSLEARMALGEPSELLQFASGVAHELNNPLMAVAGWAELSLRRAGPNEPLEDLLAATRRAADAVARLQKLSHGERELPGGAR